MSLREGVRPSKQPPHNEEIASGKEQERPRNDMKTLRVFVKGILP